MADAEVEFDPDVDEPKLLTFVRDYWHKQRGAAFMPQRKDIAPSHMKPHLKHILPRGCGRARRGFPLSPRRQRAAALFPR